MKNRGFSEAVQYMSVNLMMCSTNSIIVLILQLGSTAIGIQTSEGVVLAVEKRVTSTLIEPSSIEKIMEVDSHIGVFCALALS